MEKLAKTKKTTTKAHNTNTKPPIYCTTCSGGNPI